MLKLLHSCMTSCFNILAPLPFQDQHELAPAGSNMQIKALIRHEALLRCSCWQHITS